MNGIKMHVLQRINKSKVKNISVVCVCNVTIDF